MKKIKIGIIGCGKIFDKHYKSITSKHNNKNFSLVAVCDSDPKKLNKIKDLRVKKFNNTKTFFNNNNLDLVTICTPSGLHFNHCIMAAKNNVNVLVEKPITLDFGQSKYLNKFFNKKKLKLFVVKQNRFNKTLIILKEIIQNNLLGKIYMVNLNVFWHRPQKYYDQDKWKGSKRLDGGAIFNQASHHIDILNWLFGRNEFVSCISSRLARNIQTEDAAVINLKNKNGALISANITVLSFRKNYECTLNIISEKGNLKVGGNALNKFEHLQVLNLEKIKKIFKKYKYSTNKIFNYGHEDIYYALAQDLLKNTRTCPTANDTIESIKIIEKSHLSSKKKKYVKLN